MKKARFWIRRYFGFSQRETNGFLVLLLISFLAIVIPLVYDPEPDFYDLSADQALLDSLAIQLDKNRSIPRSETIHPDTAPAGNFKLHKFNPNTTTLEEWQELGVPKHAAQNIIKYREKAGGFTYKEQLQKIYGLPLAVYNRLYPFLDLPDATVYFNGKETSPRLPNTNKSTAGNTNRIRAGFKLEPFDLNAADTVQLKKIRGIGSKLSARIVKFREKLGGFADEQQVKEVYGLSPEVIDSLHKYTFIQQKFIPKQISINTASFEELRTHPYIGFNLAKLIIAYRTQHGTFKQVEDLRAIKILEEKQYQRLRPYIQL
ncbi:ComEA family DNA-binding protein [Adhaeribacter aquaticus]|uniref:ComEA family DNA-binding protein n=1 Tax=Adhaeribacter aquaticus TaxID=299567 RepID=UPI0004094B9E|nr:helix-hairpin-helix domain-containing protein [Adhaeribacter aquaticus]